MPAGAVAVARRGARRGASGGRHGLCLLSGVAGLRRARDRRLGGGAVRVVRRELYPDDRAAMGGAFEAPAFAQRLHELQAEAAAAVWVWGTRGDHAAAGILDFQPRARR